MDIAMPVMDGIQAAKVIKRDYKSIGVIAMSFCLDKPTIHSMLLAGAKGYVLKSDDA